MEEILHHLGCIKLCKLWDKLPYQLVQDFFHQQCATYEKWVLLGFHPWGVGTQAVFLVHLPWNQKKHPKKSGGCLNILLMEEKTWSIYHYLQGFIHLRWFFPGFLNQSTGSHPRIFIALVSGDYRSSHAWWVGLLWFIEVSCCLVERWGFWFFFLLGGWDHGTYPSIPWRIPMGMVWFGYIWVKVMVNRGTYTSPMDPMG